MMKFAELLTILVCCLPMATAGCSSEQKPNRAASEKRPSRVTSEPNRAAFERALELAIASDRFVDALVDVDEYTLHVQPKVGGGEVYVWTWNKEPLLSSLQVKAVEKGIFQVYMDLGGAGKAQFLVDIRNGAVERQL